MTRKKLMLALFLFLLFPVSVFANDQVILGGESIGIVMEYDGVMINGTYSITVDGKAYDPKQDDFQAGDVIISANGKRVASIEELNQIVRTYQEPINSIPIVIRRGDKELKKTLISVYQKEINAYQSGLYVKDEITGIGTMTYYDPIHHTFGALGHAIDPSGQAQNGLLYGSIVTGIIPSKPNAAGEKSATIDFEDPIATVTLNDTIGLYGTYERKVNGQTIEIAKQEEVHTGKAQIYTVIEGTQVEAFDVEITQVNPQDQKAIKGIEFTVTDPKLIEKSGGIVQGMSGSPIVQDGKLVGAITHVITSEPTKAYGVYLRFMKELSDSAAD